MVMSCLGLENLIVLLATQVEQACDVAVEKKGECLRETVKGLNKGRGKSTVGGEKRKNNSLRVEEFYACVQVVLNLLFL